MTDPKVSICLPTLNAMLFLEERMETILAQTFLDWELIVCDSHSDDGTWEYFQQFRADRRIRLYQVPREGLYAGWNECLKRVTGEYVYIATADDTCAPELLEKLVGALERAKMEEGRVKSKEESANPNYPITCTSKLGAERERSSNESSNLESHLPCDIAVCDFDFIDEKSRVIDPPPSRKARDFYGDWLDKKHIRSGSQELLVHLCIDVSWTTITSVLFRKSLLDEVGFFRTDCKAFADVFWAIKVALRADTVFIPEKLATWRIHGGQQSSSKDKKLLKKMLCLTKEALNEDEQLVPSKWKENSDWEEVLLYGATKQYLRVFKLNRDAIRCNATGFIAGVFSAFMHEPRYLLNRIKEGFAWKDCGNDEDYEQVMRLIDKWDVPWPPVALEAPEDRG